MTDLSTLTAESVFKYPIADVAAQIEFACADYLLPPPKGIYLSTKVDPVMVDGRSYFVRRGTSMEAIIDINTVKDAVYSELGTLLIPKLYMQDKARYLSDRPILPYRGVKLVELLIAQRVENFTQYSRSGGERLHQRIPSHFREGVMDERFVYDEELGKEVPTAEFSLDEFMVAIDEAYLPLQHELDLFLGKLNWNMYTVRIVNTTLMVERYCDYRVHQWEQEHGEEFRKQR